MLEEIKPGTKFKYVTPINAWSTDLVVGAIYEFSGIHQTPRRTYAIIVSEGRESVRFITEASFREHFTFA